MIYYLTMVSTYIYLSVKRRGKPSPPRLEA